MANRKGTVRQRILGRRLRRLRTAAGLTLEVAAIELEISQSKLSRIEKAQQQVDIHVARSMLDLYDLGGDEGEEVKQMVRDARKKAWWTAYKLPDSYSFIKFESDAVHVREYQVSFVPGLFQVPAYSRALFESAMVVRTPGQLDQAVELRMMRQRRLIDLDDPLYLDTIIEESVLRNPVGGYEVLRKQLGHLIEVTALPTVTLQVLPALQGAHAGLGSGFAVLDFGDLDEPDMAYVEHALGAVYLEVEAEVESAREKFDKLRKLALNPAASLDMLREIAAAT